jgi:O-antigen biosynthesis protein WbqP
MGSPPLLSKSPKPHTACSISMLCKRVTDLSISAAALVLLAPAMLIVTALIKLDSSGPALFRQKRVGLNGQYFEILKFRTMFYGTPDVPTDQMLKLPSPITKVGRFLRSTSLDELPQLINVLIGDMSIVGPRPALYNQTELTAKREAQGVLRFPPGITGWAQINGRDELADDIKVQFDTWYCNHWNYFLDWKIILLTLKAVASRRGAF